MQGTVTINNAAVPFEVEWHAPLDFSLKGDAGFKVAAGQDNPLAIVFDVVKWFDGIDLTKATVDADGTIYINKTSNRDIMQALRHNIMRHAHFGRGDTGGHLSQKDVGGDGDDSNADVNAN
jgi:hypothetical protein